jgi:LAO/AO transport system kinase
MPAKTLSTTKLPLKNYQEGIRRGDRTVLGQAITLVESDKPGDRTLGEQLIQRLLPATGNSIRIGITGVPGVGKSMFIEALGTYLTSAHKKVAVLAIDPSSQKTKGSILGDKTRMEDLSKNPMAFIRPTASGSAIGGVAEATQDSILLCEAAGFDVIIVETVGVGQSEIAVRGMVDFFLLLMLAGAGDELQGIKKGIIEIADCIAITKVDGDNITRARQAQADFQHALHWLQSPESGWKPTVLTVSALERTGINEVWTSIELYVARTRTNGFFERQRNHQRIESLYQNLDRLIRHKVLRKSTRSLLAFEKKVLSKTLSPAAAARMIIQKL